MTQIAKWSNGDTCVKTRQEVNLDIMSTSMSLMNVSSPSYQRGCGMRDMWSADDDCCTINPPSADINKFFFFKYEFSAVFEKYVKCLMKMLSKLA